MLRGCLEVVHLLLCYSSVEELKNATAEAGSNETEMEQGAEETLTNTDTENTDKTPGVFPITPEIPQKKTQKQNLNVISQNIFTLL